MSNAIPIIRQAGEGEHMWFAGGGAFTWKATAAETGGAFILMTTACARQDARRCTCIRTRTRRSTCSRANCSWTSRASSIASARAGSSSRRAVSRTPSWSPPRPRTCCPADARDGGVLLPRGRRPAARRRTRTAADWARLRAVAERSRASSCSARRRFPPRSRKPPRLLPRSRCPSGAERRQQILASALAAAALLRGQAAVLVVLGVALALLGARSARHEAGLHRRALDRWDRDRSARLSTRLVASQLSAQSRHRGNAADQGADVVLGGRRICADRACPPRTRRTRRCTAPARQGRRWAAADGS